MAITIEMIHKEMKKIQNDLHLLKNIVKVPDVTDFFENAGVGLSDGTYFQGKGYVRLNFGCPKATLLEALERMKYAVTNMP